MTESKHHVVPPPPTTAAALRRVARGGPVPNLKAYWRVEAIVREANARGEDPISFEEIKRRMDAKSVRHSTVRACVAEMERQGNVVVAPDGVLWCPMSVEAVRYESKRKWVKL
ncbi:MAG: hypothetical protein ACYDCK_04385 [Thermoplasmatota archaeon]